MLMVVMQSIQYMEGCTMGYQAMDNVVIECEE